MLQDILLALCITTWLASGTYGFYLFLTIGHKRTGTQCPEHLTVVASAFVYLGPVFLLIVLFVFWLDGQKYPKSESKEPAS